MGRAVVVCTALLWLYSIASPDTYTVTSVRPAALRGAIRQANARPGPDNVVFAPALAGKIIRPRGPLPRVVDGGTTIDGDINGDGRPDVMLDGSLGLEDGLCIRAGDCTVHGLAIGGCSGYGISIVHAGDCTVTGCYLGLNLAGTAGVANTGGGVVCNYSDRNVIGRRGRGRRNVIGVGPEGPITAPIGVHVQRGSYNRISGNYVGLTADGRSPLGLGNTGITVADGTANQVTRNVVAAVHHGIGVGGAENVVAGNWLGLAADGDTLVPLGDYGYGVHVYGTSNLIGGTTAGSRNVFAGGTCHGIVLRGSGNVVAGNYFGLNAAGTAHRPLLWGIRIDWMSGSSHTIGGLRAAAGNVFAPGIEEYGHPGHGIEFIAGGRDSVVRRNTFGLLPAGGRTEKHHTAIYVRDVSVSITGNHIAGATVAVRIDGRGGTGDPGGNASIYRNRFEDCGYAVHVDSHSGCHLGDLGNADSTDDGRNVFRGISYQCIANYSANRTKAEGNDFGTTDRSMIETMIWDRRDDPTLGRVDFIPLKGGVIPTGGREQPALALTGLSAVRGRSGRGAQITFALSAPAVVTAQVLSLAGRPVATIAHGTAFGQGLQTLLWSGRSDNGLMVPSGTYLVRIEAASDDGAVARALVTTQVRR